MQTQTYTVQDLSPLNTIVFTDDISSQYLINFLAYLYEVLQADA